MLEIKSVSKKYVNGAEEVFAVRAVSLTLKPGEYLSIAGPSGAGKSTLLHILGGLEKPQAGMITHGGRDIYALADDGLCLWRNKTVGFVFQFYHLIEELNILENVGLPALQNGRKTAFKKAGELLEYLGMAKRALFFPSQLSGGERQKTAIARALINDPQIVLCDEPTGNLDKDSQGKVIDLLERLNREKGKTLVLVTHNPELAKRSSRQIRMEAGEIINA